MRSLLTSVKGWKRSASTTLRIITALLFAGTNISGLAVARVSAQSVVEAKQSQTSTDEQEAVDGEILIKLKAAARPDIPSNLSPEFTGTESLDKLNKSEGAQKFEAVTRRSKDGEKSELDGWYKVSLPGAGKKIKSKADDKAYKKLQDVINRYKNNEQIEVAGFNAVSHSMTVPNDGFYVSRQWNMPKINAPEAWDVSTGSSSTVVAVIDSGVQFSHEDLRNNMWDNPACSHSPEDYKEGYDFIANSCFQTDDNGHGTHVAGIIGAVGNNGVGVAGMNWNVKVMGLKVLDSRGQGNTDNITRAIRFAADKGAKVANLSFGCNFCDAATIQLEEDAIGYASDRGVVVVAAAGNGRYDANGNFLGRIDVLDTSPANIDKVVTVGSTDSNDALAFDSNFGPKVDVTAPGVGIMSTIGVGPLCGVTSGDNLYCTLSGTSQAAPHVAGLAALLISVNPNLTTEQIRQQLKRPESVADLGTAGRDNDYGWGRINANEAVRRTSSRTLAPFFSNIKSRQQLSLAQGASGYTINGGIPGPNFTQYYIDIGQGRNPSSWTRIANSGAQINNGALGSIPAQLFNGTTYTIKLTGYSVLGVSPPDVPNKLFESSVFDVKLAVPSAPVPDTTPPSAPGNFSAASNSASQVNLSWSASTDNVGVAGYRVFRTNAGTTPIATVTGTSYADTGLSPGTAYSYYVKAYDAAGNVSASTSTVNVTTGYNTGGSDTTPPSVPTNVTATAVSSSQINIGWSPSTDNVGVTTYVIFRNGLPIANVGGNVTTYTDSGLASSTTYSYSVGAGDGAGNGSMPSNAVSATTLAPSADTTPPTAPTNLVAYVVSSSQIYLNWRASSDNVGVTGYRIYRSDRGLNPVATVSGSTQTYIDNGLLTKTSYTYYITAIDAAGNSSQFSNGVSATTK